MVQANDFVKGSLGEKCRVKFIPLFVRRIDEALNKSITSPKVIGLIVVSSRRSKATTSLTYWHKYGLYIASHFNPEYLNWRNGILVGAIGSIETTVSKSIDDCTVPNSRSDPPSMSQRLRRKTRKFIITLDAAISASILLYQQEGNSQMTNESNSD